MSRTLISDDSIARGLTSSTFQSSTFRNESQRTTQSLMSDDSIAAASRGFGVGSTSVGKTLISDDSIARGLSHSYHEKDVCVDLFLDKSQVYGGSSSEDETDETPSIRSIRSISALHQVEINLQKYRLQLMQAKTMVAANLWSKLSIKLMQRRVQHIKNGIVHVLSKSNSNSNTNTKKRPHISLLNVTIPELSEDSPLGTPLYDILTPLPVPEEEELMLFDPRDCAPEWLREAGSITRVSNPNIPCPAVFTAMLNALPVITVEDQIWIEEAREQIALEHSETF